MDYPMWTTVFNSWYQCHCYISLERWPAIDLQCLPYFIDHRIHSVIRPRFLLHHCTVTATLVWNFRCLSHFGEHSMHPRTAISILLPSVTFELGHDHLAWFGAAIKSWDRTQGKRCNSHRTCIYLVSNCGRDFPFHVTSSHASFILLQTLRPDYSGLCLFVAKVIWTKMESQ